MFSAQVTGFQLMSGQGFAVLILRLDDGFVMHDLHIRRHHHRSAAFTEPETEVDVVEDDREILIKSADRIKSCVRINRQAAVAAMNSSCTPRGRLSITAGSQVFFRLQNAALPFDQHHPLMLQAAIGIEQTCPTPRSDTAKG